MASNPERRVFLRVVGAAAASWACGGCASESRGSGGGGAGGSSTTNSVSSSAASGDPDAGCVGVGVSVGDPAAFASAGIHFVPGTSVLIGRDSGGVYALSSICTHRSCNMNFEGQLTSSGVECRCHGSVFGADGHVVEGPAFSPLAAFPVSVACGQLWVDTSQTVSTTQRLMV